MGKNYCRQYLFNVFLPLYSPSVKALIPGMTYLYIQPHYIHCAVVDSCPYMHVLDTSCKCFYVFQVSTCTSRHLGPERKGTRLTSLVPFLTSHLKIHTASTTHLCTALASSTTCMENTSVRHSYFLWRGWFGNAQVSHFNHLSLRQDEKLGNYKIF